MIRALIVLVLAGVAGLSVDPLGTPCERLLFVLAFVVVFVNSFWLVTRLLEVLHRR